MLCSLLLGATAAGAQENAALEKARNHIVALEYKEADDALELAWKSPGNSTAQLVDILRLKGIVAASLGNSSRAVTNFLTMFTIDPEAKVADGLPPRVMTPYFEAKGRLSEKGALKLKTSSSRDADGNAQLIVEVVADPLGLVKSSRISFRLNGGARQTVTSETLPGMATVAGVQIDWWAVALNEFGGVLGTFGSEAQPLVGPPPRQPTPQVDATAPAKAPSTPMSPVRIAAFPLLGGAAACAGIGIALGANAASLKTQIDTLPTDASGHVTTMSQKDAQAIDQQQRGLATGANVLFIGAGALAVTAVVLFIAGSTPPVTPTAFIGPGGASLGVAGTF